MQRQGGGGSIGQSLQYIDPTAPERSGPAGGDVLLQKGLVVRPEIPVLKGGGSIGQSLQYIDLTAPERSGPAGGDVLLQKGLIVRPEIPVLKGGRQSKGGFIPSCMGGVVGAGTYLAPIAALTAKRMISRSKKGGGSKESWAQRRTEAKEIYQKFCKPSATDVNRLAAALHKGIEGSAAANDILVAYEKAIINKTHNDAIKKVQQIQKRVDREAKKITKKQAPTSLVFDTTRQVVRKNITLRSRPTTNIWATLLKNAENKLKERVSTKSLMRQVITKDKIESLAKLIQSGKSTKKFFKNFEKNIKSQPMKSRREKYLNEKAAARTVLETLGVPMGKDVIEFVKSKRKGNSMANFLRNFESRRGFKTIKPLKTKKVKVISKPEIIYSNVNSLPKTSKSKKILEATAKPLVSTRRPFTQERRSAYNQAKTNLASIRAKPHSSKIMKLVSLRQKGNQKQINNFIKSYRSVQ